MIGEGEDRARGGGTHSLLAVVFGRLNTYVRQDEAPFRFLAVPLPTLERGCRGRDIN